MSQVEYVKVGDLGIILAHVTAHQLIHDDQFSNEKNQMRLRVFLTGGNHIDIVGNDRVMAFGEALGRYLEMTDFEVP